VACSFGSCLVAGCVAGSSCYYLAAHLFSASAGFLRCLLLLVQLVAVVASWFLPVSASVLAFLECSSWAVFYVIIGAELWV
jgi:hypothetical protein